METEIKKMSLESKDLVAERVEQVKALFPEIVTEGEGSIDFEKLRLILGDEVDEDRERYAFTWPGKADAIRQAQIPSTATLRPDKESSVDWDTTENLYIEGDNLEVLKLLQRGYHGKVKMIYIDPPYNTGHDFVYKDSFQDSIENYKEQAGLVDQTSKENSGRYHSDWLSMMYPRLRLARELLADDGVIFISIDDNESKNIRQICDEIFGEVNYIGCFPRVTKKAGKSSDAIARNHDYVYCYSKGGEPAFYLPEHNDEGFNQEDEYVHERGKYKLNQTLDYDSLAYSPSLDYPIEIEGHVLVPGGSREAQERRLAGDHARADWAWRWSPELFQYGLDNGFVVLKTSGSRPRIYTKTYQNAQIVKRGKSFAIEPITRTKAISTLTLLDNEYSNDNSKKNIAALFGASVFDYSKPVALLKKLLECTTKDDDMVLDFFSGSGTLAHAVFECNEEDGNNRKFIMAQLPEMTPAGSVGRREGYGTICQIGEERIRRAGKKIKAEIEEENKQLKIGEEPKPIPDIGFRVLKLDSSNFDKVEGGMLVESIVKADRTHEDIIFEMMVKWGLDLSLPMEEAEVLGYPITSIAADELICCMDEGLTIEILEAIAALEPKRVFFLDSILTDTVKLNAAQIFKRASERSGVEIELRTV